MGVGGAGGGGGGGGGRLSNTLTCPTHPGGSKNTPCHFML